MKKTNKTKTIPPVYSSGYTTGPHNIKINPFVEGEGYSGYVTCSAIDFINKLINPSNKNNGISTFLLRVDDIYAYNVKFTDGEVKLYEDDYYQSTNNAYLDVRSLPNNEEDLLQMFFDYGYCHQSWNRYK